MKKTIFITIIVAVVAFASGYFFPRSNKLSENNIEAEPSFYMTSNLSCNIIKSSSKDEIGRKISFINLDSEEPKVLFGDSSGASPMKKIYETSDTLVIQLVASGSGSVDTFVIDKNTGLFSRAAAGSFLGVYSIASKGNCK